MFANFTLRMIRKETGHLLKGVNRLGKFSILVKSSS